MGGRHHNIEIIPTLFILSGGLVLIVLIGTAICLIEITSVVGDAWDCFLGRTCSTRTKLALQTIVEDNLAVVSALTHRHLELVNSRAAVFIDKGIVGVSDGTGQRIVINIGMSVTAAIRCNKLCSDRRNTRPYRIYGSPPVVLTEFAAAVEVSIDMVAP